MTDQAEKYISSHQEQEICVFNEAFLHNIDNQQFLENLRLSVRIAEIKMENKILAAKVQFRNTFLKMRKDSCNNPESIARGKAILAKCTSEIDIILTTANSSLKEIKNRIKIIFSIENEIKSQYKRLVEEYSHHLSNIIQNRKMLRQRYERNLTKEETAFKQNALKLKQIMEQLKLSLEADSGAKQIKEFWNFFELVKLIRSNIDFLLKEDNEKVSKNMELKPKTKFTDKIQALLLQIKVSEEKLKPVQAMENTLKSDLIDLKQKLERAEEDKTHMRTTLNEFLEEKTHAIQSLKNQKRYELERIERYKELLHEQLVSLTDMRRKNEKIREEKAKLQMEITQYEDKQKIHENRDNSDCFMWCQAKATTSCLASTSSNQN